jgi:general secretion pathway protein L
MVLDLATDPRAAVLALRARLAALRVPLALAALALVFWSAGTVIETNRARAEDAALRAAITAEVRRDFLPTGPIVDIPTQVARELDRRRRLADQSPDTPAPLRLLHRASVILAASEAKVLAVSHRDGGELTLDLTAADFATLDRIAAELRAQGLTVRTGQSSAEAPGRVNGTLLVEAER